MLRLSCLNKKVIQNNSDQTINILMFFVSVSIGSNIDREKNVGFALKSLKQKFSVVSFSPIYEISAVGFKGDDFFNLVGQFKIDLSIDEVRTFFNQLE